MSEPGDETSGEVESATDVREAKDWLDGLAAMVGHSPETVRLLYRVEKACRGEPLGTVQLALAAALWRCTCQRPGYEQQSGLLLRELVLRDGGRQIQLVVQQLLEGT